MIGFLFPGQGSQEPGMGRDICDGLSEARRILDEASDVLGYDMGELLFEGPADVLNDTRYAQPAIYTCSAMYLEKARADGLECDFVAGHSLGEYDALLAAGVYSFADGLRLVAKRGEAMSRMNGRGCMAAVLGLSRDELERLLEDLPDVVMANINTKNQIVVSGAKEGIAALEERLAHSTTAKIKRLRVSAAFHSPQMEDAARIMAPLIEGVAMKEPTCQVVPNVTGVPTQDVATIKRCLLEQMTGQVLWCDSIIAMKAAGVNAFYEVGYGNVIKKMNKSIVFRPKCMAIEV